MVATLTSIYRGEESLPGLSKEFTPGIAAALQELVGVRIIEMLPSLQNIFVEGIAPLGPFLEYFEQFITARQLSGHPVAISARYKTF